MTGTMTPAQALSAQLAAIPSYLRPNDEAWMTMLEAAGDISSAAQAAVIYQMEGLAADWGVDAPPTSLRFPQDHRLHLGSGDEWYWLSCHLRATGPGGPARIAVLLSMERVRVLANAVQKEAGWSDEAAQVVWCAVTAVVSSPSGSTITRRNPNVQWAPLGGIVEFPGDQFVYRCGADVLTGSGDVLPLTISVDDGENISLTLTGISQLPPPTAFFLQGMGGVTPFLPGIYYSWPQLIVSGPVTIDGVTYQTEGRGWLDHQLMMQTVPTQAPPAPPPGFSGWSWCQFNFDDDRAFCAAAFHNGPMSARSLVPYGYHLRRQGDHWDAEAVVGNLRMDRFVTGLHGVIQPTEWTYTATNMPMAPAFSPLDLMITTAPWHLDCTFETGDLAVPSEVPVSAALTDRALTPGGAPAGRAITGEGYCESVGFEDRGRYMERAAAFLRGGVRTPRGA